MILRSCIVAVALGATLPVRVAFPDDHLTPPRIGVLAAPYASAPANQGLSEGLPEDLLLRADEVIR